MITALFLVGIVLAGLGAATGHLARQAEADFPPRGRVIEAGGLRQHVIEQGDGPPLVMIHGAYGAAEDFVVSLMPRTADRFQAIAIDRPGHGYSDRGQAAATPDRQATHLHAALEQLGVQKPILLGFSYGGAVALSYALQYPDRVAALVLVSPATHPWRRIAALPFGIADAPLLGPLLKHTIVTPTGHLLKDGGVARVFHPEPMPDAFAQTPLSLSLRPNSYAANEEDIRELDAFLQRQSLLYGQLRLPLLVVVNDADRSVSSTIHGRRLVEQVPGAELIVADGGGHPLHFSRQAVVLDAIDRAARRAGVTLR